MEVKKAIVFGASGIVGGNLINRLLNSEKAQWTIVAVSTSEPNFWPWWGEKRVQWISINLLDEQECKNKFQENSSLHSVDYVFFEAYKQSDDNNRMIEENMAMFKNALLILNVAKNVKRVHLNTGSKYYGAFDGAYKTPAEEFDERRQSPFFYYNQEDYLSELQQGKSWKYLVTRPPELGGYSKGYMNLAQSIGVYATLCHELNLKFKCPGNTTSWERAMDIADVGLLVELIEEGVLSDNPKYQNQAFNCNNGDIIRWKYLWPRIAEYFKLEYEAPTDKEFLLHDRVGDKKEDWKRIAKKHSLKIDDLSKAATFDFADKCIGRQWDSFLSMNKAREAGFKGYKATDRMYTEIFDYLRKLNVIPTW